MPHLEERALAKSKTVYVCSECGYKNSEIKDLKIRTWKCPNCGVEHDRDRNAAINILRVGASTLRGDEVRPEQSGSVYDTRIPSF